MTTPTLAPALRLGLRAAAGQGWLVAPGLLVAGLRRAATLPAILTGLVLVARAVLDAFAAAPLDPAGALARGLATLWSPAFLALVGGLWLSGALLGAALRVAYLSGAFPALAGALGPGGGGSGRFVEGVAHGFPRVAAAAVLAFAIDLAGTLFAAAIGLGAARVTLHALGGGGSVALAAAVAFALAVAALVALATTVLADATVARAAIAGDGPAHAVAGAAARLLARPGAFLLGAMIVAGVGVLAALTVQGVGSAALGLVAAADPAVLLGPQAMIWVMAALAAAAVDLWWLGTVAVLACGEGER